MPIKDITKQIKAHEKEQVRTVSLVTTRNCNLSCQYCYEKNAQRDEDIMELSTAKEVISDYMIRDDEFDRVTVEFFGGEPLLAFPLIQKTVEWVCSKEWPKKYNFLIGSNGTVFNDTIKEWLLKYRNIVSITVSIDGTKQAHDLARDRSYDMLIQHLPFLIKNWPEQPAKMTICAETIPFMAESIIHLEEKGLFFTANVVFEDIWGDSENKKKLLEIYAEQLALLVNYYTKHLHLFPVYPLLKPIPDFLGDNNPGIQTVGDISRFCGAGHEMVAIDVDGKRYPCHRFLPWVTGCDAPKEAVNRQPKWAPDKCAECKLLQACPTCAGFNWEINGDTGHRSTFHCDAYKLELLASAKIEAFKLGGMEKEKVDHLSPDKKAFIARRLRAILDLLKNGI